MPFPNSGATFRSDEELVDVLCRLQRGTLTPDQVRLREQLHRLAEDPDLFENLKSPLRERAMAALEWAREDLLTIANHARVAARTF